MRVGEQISDVQRDYLNAVTVANAPIEHVAQYLTVVLRDTDLGSGAEDIHPDWMKVWTSRSPELRNVVSKRTFEEMGKFFAQLSPIDSALGEINPDQSTIVFLLGAGASK